MKQNLIIGISLIVFSTIFLSVFMINQNTTIKQLESENKQLTETIKAINNKVKFDIEKHYAQQDSFDVVIDSLFIDLNLDSLLKELKNE